jgi:hypothetical protein
MKVTRGENNFAPRVGFAWRRFNNDRTVIRTGYGIFYNYNAAYVGPSENAEQRGQPYHSAIAQICFLIRRISRRNIRTS